MKKRERSSLIIVKKLKLDHRSKCNTFLKAEHLCDPGLHKYFSAPESTIQRGKISINWTLSKLNFCSTEESVKVMKREAQSGENIYRSYILRRTSI